VLFNECRVSVLKNEKVLKICCPTINILKTSECGAYESG
jgi:hypothetical protein